MRSLIALLGLVGSMLLTANLQATISQCNQYPATFNVKDYGASGNGVTDDTAAVSSAVSAAISAGGGTVAFPSGSYKLSSTLNLVGSSGITLLGSTGKGSGNTYISFAMSDSSTGIDARGSKGLSLLNITVCYSSTTYSGYLIDLSANGSTASEQFSMIDGTLRQTGSTSTAKAFLYLDGLVGAYLQNIALFGANNLLIGANPSGSSTPSSQVSFQGCSFANWIQGAIYCPGDNYKLDTSWFEIEATGTPCIYNNASVGCNNLMVTNCWFGDCISSNTGLITLYNANNVNILGSLLDCSGHSPTTLISIFGACQDWSIRGNYFNNVTTAILFNTGSTLDGAGINGNVFGVGVTTGLSSYSNLGTNVNLDGNSSDITGVSSINFTGSATWAPGTIANGAVVTNSIACTGVIPGNFALASPPYDLQGLTMTTFVSTSGEVSISLFNGTGASVTLASGTWTVRGFRE